MAFEKRKRPTVNSPANREQNNVFGSSPFVRRTVMGDLAIQRSEENATAIATTADLDTGSIELNAASEEHNKDLRNALRILREIDSTKYGELTSFGSKIRVSEGGLNATKEPQDGVSYTYGQTSTPFMAEHGLTVASNLDADGEIAPGDLMRFRTREEQDQWREANPGKDLLVDGNGNKVKATREEARAMIQVHGVIEIVVDPYSFKWHNSLTEVLAHELFGHAYHDAIDDVVEGWIWTVLGDSSKGGHDANNTSGMAAVAAEKRAGKGYGKAKKAVKNKEEWEK